MKKVLSLILVIALVAGIAVTGTMAYLTDRDNETNVFTVGDVNIELSEEYAQGSQLLPGVTITKKPTIENVGKNDAWVWVTYAVPAALDDVVTVAANWTAKGVDSFTVDIDGVAYTVFPLLYDAALAAGEKTTAAFNSVTLSAKVDADPDGKWYTVEAGKDPVPLNWDNSKVPVIYVNAYAIQKDENIDSVEDGYAAYNKQWGDNGAEYGELPVMVDTAEELKEVLTAAGSAGAGDTSIVLSSDLDLTGVNWTPIKVDGYNGADIVTIDGGGNTIKGLTAPLFAGGFAGGSGIVIKNLTIADSKIVSGNTLGSGAFIESVDSMAVITLKNCHLLNSTVTGGPGSRTGGLIGWTAGYNNVNDGPVKTYVTIEDCSVIGSTITCDGSVGGIYGHAGNNAWTYSTVKNCTVKNCKLNSTDDGGWRVGVVVGTANVGELTISGITESGNTLTQTGKTAPAGQSNLYGRFVPGSTGKLVIDGVEIENN